MYVRRGEVGGRGREEDGWRGRRESGRRMKEKKGIPPFLVFPGPHSTFLLLQRKNIHDAP